MAISYLWPVRFYVTATADSIQSCSPLNLRLDSSLLRAMANDAAENSRGV